MTDRNPEFDLPGPLQNALREMHAGPAVPPEVDERILYAAKQAFVRRHRMRQIVRGALAGVGASAAVVALALWMSMPGDPPPGAAPLASAAVGPDDVDRDGTVDILDAYVVARTLSSGGPLDPRWDRNGDGQVDAADVNQIAQAAVALPVATTPEGTLQ